MSQTSPPLQVRHIGGAVLAGCLLEGWLLTRELVPLRAASTASYSTYVLATRAYACLLHLRVQRLQAQLLEERPSPAELVDSSTELVESGGEQGVQSPISVGSDDTWELAFRTDEE